MTTPIDQLIELCQNYLRVASHPSRSSAFIEWVIQIANGSAKPSPDRIKTKFLVARIWGSEELLDQIRSKLDSILVTLRTSPILVTLRTSPILDSAETITSEELERDEVKVEESSANINDQFLVEVKIGTPPSNSSQYHIVSGGYIISNSLDRRTHIRPRIDKLKVVNARNVAHILKEEIGWMGKINDLIPMNLLIHLFKDIYLWKGTEGILINQDNVSQYYFGHLSSDCRSIISNNITQLVGLGSEYHDIFKNYIRDHYQQLVKIVKENVSNPDYFNEMITYSVRVTSSPGIINTGSFSLGYCNHLEISPIVRDEAKLNKIRAEVKNKNNSFETLVEKVTRILNN